ncbi:hypothetical protein R2A130_1276 [Ahrensia sp. R2A130]|nr:hypothetical protein R2A130_1276 [Ahrensia sp. R2A130]
MPGPYYQTSLCPHAASGCEACRLLAARYAVTSLYQGRSAGRHPRNVLGRHQVVRCRLCHVGLCIHHRMMTHCF